MTTIFTSEHKTDQGRIYKLSIIDTDAGASFIGEMTVNSDGFTIKDTGKTRSLHSRINGKAVQFSVQVENADQENWIQNLATEKEGRYLVEIERDTNLIFRGVITTDSATIDNAPKPYGFKLEALDGLTILKDVRAPLTGNIRLIDHFYDAILSNPATDLYGISDSLVTFCMNWWSKEHEDSGQDTTQNALFKTYLTKGTFQSSSNVNLSSYAVLEEICKLFNARLYYDEAVYHFEQLSIRESAASFDRQVFNREKTLLTTETQNLDIDIDQLTNFHLANGKFSILEPLRSVTVKYDTDPLQSFLPPDPVFEQEDPIVLRNIGEILTGLTQVYFKIFFEIENILRGPEDGPFAHVVFLLYLRVDDQYLSGNPNDLEWTTDSDAFVIFAAGYTGFSFPAINGFFELTTSTEFSTPEIPTTGDVEIALRAGYRNFNNATQEWEYEFDPPDGPFEPASHTWILKTQSMYLLSESDDLVPVQITASQDSGFANETLNIAAGDGYTPLRDGVLSMTDALFGGFTVTTGWRADGTGTYVPLSELIAKTMLSQRLRPLKMLSGTLLQKDNVFGISNRISYDSRVFIFNNSSLQTNFDEIKVEGIQLSENETGITTEIELEAPEVIGTGPTGGGNDPTGEGGSDPNDPPNQGREGLITSEVIYENVAITSVPILEADDDYFVTGDEIIIKDNITGYEHKVTVAAPLTQGDTTITIESYTPGRNIAIYSAITFAPGQLLNLRPKYQLFSNASGSSVTITDFTLPDETVLSDSEMSRKLRVFRQTSKLIYNIGYTVDSTNNKIDFAWNLQDEYVEVELL